MPRSPPIMPTPNPNFPVCAPDKRLSSSSVPREIAATKDCRFPKRWARPEHVDKAVPWWEYWKDGSECVDTELAFLSNNSAVEDRFHEAARQFRFLPFNLKTDDPTDSFRFGRWWPKGYLIFLWEQFRFFAGLLSVTPIWDKVHSLEDANGPADEDDDEEELSQQESQFKRKKLKPLYAHYGMEPVKVTTDEEVQALIRAEREKKTKRVKAFLADPEKATGIFLGIYGRKEGLWSDKNLVSLPYLLEYFYRFLLHKDFLPPSSLPKLQAALDVIERAKVQLPLTSKLMKELPNDEVNLSIEACFSSTTRDDSEPMADATSSESSVPDTLEIGPFESDEWLSASSHSIEAWLPARQLSLLSLLGGPSSFPLHYESSGIVERNMRRILSVRLPTQRADLCKGSDLERRFATVTLESWLNWDHSSSCCEDNGKSDEADMASPSFLVPTGLTIGSAHNPLVSSIDVHVSCSVAKIMEKHMGIYATWVQLVSREDGQNAWFWKDVQMVVPSFY